MPKTTRPRTPSGAPIAGLAVALALLMPTAVLAQQREIYGADGRVIGREVTGSDGSSTIYGSDGRVETRTSTDSQGVTTVYDASGRRVGTITNPASQAQ